MTQVSRQSLEAFFPGRRIAIVGASRRPGGYGAQLLRALRARGVDAVPVNPLARQIGGVACFPTLLEVDPPVAAAIAVVPPHAQRLVVEQCVQAGIPELWIQEQACREPADPAIVPLARARGLRVISGHCPMMYMPDPGFPHTLHRFVRKLRGAAPPEA